VGGAFAVRNDMPLIASTEMKDAYDAVIVGSGATGGQFAYTLAMEGAKVLVVEAGRKYDPVTEVAMFQTHDQAPLRGASTPDKPLFFHDATVDGGFNVPGEPYTQASSDPAKQFQWWRARMLGGRSNHWGRTAQRMGPYDFRSRTRDGVGVDWPIAYEDLAPYYDKVEMLMGVYGTNENIENVPHSSPGILLPPPKPRIGELYVRKHVRKLGIGVHPVHRAVLTTKLDHTRLPARIHPGNPTAQRILADDMQKRSKCYWATFCPRGCAIRATFQSTTVHFPPAFATGNLDIVTDAMVREVELGPDGRARGVVFIDKRSGREFRAKGRAVVLAGGSMESVRLLLNSKSTRFPQGIGNSGGWLGRAIMDTVCSEISAQVPAWENLPPHNEDGAGGQHVYIPWWLHAEQRAGKLDFPSAYQLQFATGRRMPTVGTFAGLERLTGGSYGRRLKADARRYFGSFVTIEGDGRMIPNEKSFCEIDPSGTKDKWGIPVLRFHWEWSDDDFRQVVHQQRTLVAIYEALGARILDTPDFAGRKSILSGGQVNHEVGGARMGSSPSESVTNPWGQTWDVQNLFVADGAVCASMSEKAPTLTLMALAWRSADRLLDLWRKGEL
jgi:choline dehydrogenase-like flavoprotein